MDHFILTRFNIPFIVCQNPQGGHLPLKVGSRRLGCDPDWLSHRFKLFKRWTLPSVQSQSCKQFRWLCFFDEETPQEYLQEAESWNMEIILVPYTIQSYSGAIIYAPAIADRVTSEWVATTRLDNDDMIAWDFVERVQQNLRETEEWLTFPTGAAGTTDMSYGARQVVNNTFLTRVASVVETTTKCVPTVYEISHVKVATSLVPVREIASPVLWCVVVHTRNMNNNIRLIDPAKPLSFCDMQERFPHLKLSTIDSGDVNAQ